MGVGILLTPVITLSGVQSPVVLDKLIAQIIAAQGDKAKLVPAGTGAGSRADWRTVLPM